jgi:hypothetical protein
MARGSLRHVARLVVDAGSSDSYGLDPACRWLAALATRERNWLRRLEFRGEASLSWTLSCDELAAIDTQLEADGIREKLRAVGQGLASQGSQAPRSPAALAR